MQFEFVITLEQQSAAEARAQARAEAQEAAAQARAEAQAAAAEARAEAARIREQVQRDVQEQIREQVQHRVHVGEGRGGDQGPGGPVIMVPPFREDDIPPRVMEAITIFVVAAVICIVGLPIARAIGRWIDRRGLPTPVNAELAAQITRIEQAVDTMSVEVERISEAQRFQAKLLSDREKVRA